MSEKFYTCRSDRAFKEVFMNKNNKDLLICLLEEILDLKIEELEYLNLERNVGSIHIKRKHFDLNLKTDKGYIQVEVNTKNEEYINPRNTAYICDTYSHYILKGEDYTEDKKIIQINFSYNKSSNKLLSVYKLRDEENILFVNNLLIYEFYMDNYLKIWYSKNENEIDKYKHIIMLDLKPDDLENLSKKDKVVRKYMEELERVNQNPEFREYMSAEEDNRKIENSLRKSWKRQGLEEGRKEGRKEASENIAKELLKKGMKKEEIMQITGLSKEEIESLYNE